LPQLRPYEREIAELETQIAREQADVDAVTQKLEAPARHERARAYCGRDFSLRELEEKVAIYEQRINSKEQQLWEKRILFDEIEEKITQIVYQSGTTNPENLKMFERSGTLRAESIALRSKKMAAIAESAVYQAQVGELDEEKQSAKAEIVAASERVARGEAYDLYAEKVIRKHERDIRVKRFRWT
jgi:uncharacterized coiled-coil protein SlyX